jgi:hypothetical protein
MSTEWIPALVALEWTGEITVKIDWRQTIIMDHAKPDEQRRFLEKLSRLKWLSPQLRGAVLKELGGSLRGQNREIRHAVGMTLRLMIQERKAELVKRKARPRGGCYEQAVEDVAAGQGMTVAALKKRLLRARR